MWHHIKNEVLDNKFSLSLAAFAVASLLAIHAVWGDGLDAVQVRTVVFLMCVTAALLTLHVNRIYTGGSDRVTQSGALARLGVMTLFWVGALGAFCVVGRAFGFLSVNTMWGLLSASGLLAGLNAVFAIGSGISVRQASRPDLDRIAASFFEVLLVGAAVFWAVLLSGYFESASPIRSVLLYVFFTPVGALAHLFLGALLCAVSVFVFSVRRSLETTF